MENDRPIQIYIKVPSSWVKISLWLIGAWVVVEAFDLILSIVLYLNGWRGY